MCASTAILTVMSPGFASLTHVSVLLLCFSLPPPPPPSLAFAHALSPHRMQYSSDWMRTTLPTSRRRHRMHFWLNTPDPGTFTMHNVKSISDRDIICHQPLQRAVAMDFDRDKNKQKRSHRVLKEDATIERRSAFTIRLVCISVYDGWQPQARLLHV